jgi:phosphoribosylanthranilate isomerase
VAVAVAAGADAVGFIFAPESARLLALHEAAALVRAVPAFVTPIAVFVDPSAADVEAVAALGAVPQFSGDESSERVAMLAAGRHIKAVHFASGTTYAPADAERLAAQFPFATIMFDSRVGSRHGGTGTVFAWDAIVALARRRPVIVSGGLTPDNVADCVRTVRPFAVDVRSGVETDGKKDPAKVRAFVRAVRETDAQA